jgi:hypothetical protein
MSCASKFSARSTTPEARVVGRTSFECEDKLSPAARL